MHYSEKTNAYDTDALIKRTVTEIGETLSKQGRFLTCAESLTCGMIAASFGDIPGCSNWFSYGFVTYSNEAKQNMLGVKSALIEKNTAVDSEVAIEMALGAIKKSGADYSVAVTGLAGPFVDENGNAYPLDPRHEKGLVFIAAASKFGAVVKRCVFHGERNDVRKQTVLKAVLLLKSLMQNGL